MKIWDLRKSVHEEEFLNATAPELHHDTYGATIRYAVDYCGATHAALENDYIDRDYRTVFSLLYARKFRRHLATCRRIHFFKASLPAPSHPKPAELSAGDFEYLGYVILRPLDIGVIGRTALAQPGPPEETDLQLSHPCSAAFRPHIDGSELSVRAVMFMQQDGLVLTCAQAALWTLARQLHKSKLARWFSPADVSTAARSLPVSGRALPSGGLYNSEVVTSMVNLDLNPIPLVFEDSPPPPERRREMLSFVATHVASGLPTLLGVPGHAVVAIGIVALLNHEYSSYFRGIVRGRLPGARPVGLIEELVVGLVIHDDALGPYRILPVDPRSRRLLEASSAADLVSPINESYGSFRDVDMAIAPTPERTNISAKDVRNILARLLSSRQTGASGGREGKWLAGKALAAGCKLAGTYLHSAKDDIAPPLLCSPYLIKGSALKSLVEDGAELAGLPRAVRAHLSRMRLPRFVWYCEITCSSLIIDSGVEFLGAVVLDSTEHRDARSYLMIHLPGGILSRNASTNSEAVRIFCQTRLMRRDNLVLGRPS